jgi:hypothetical protein
MERFAITVAPSRQTDDRWQVRRGEKVYGGYLTREAAILDAIDTAQDAREQGMDAEVWVEENGNEPHLAWSSAPESNNA